MATQVEVSVVQNYVCLITFLRKHGSIRHKACICPLMTYCVHAMIRNLIANRDTGVECTLLLTTYQL